MAWRAGVSRTSAQGMNLLGNRFHEAHADSHGTLHEPSCRPIRAQDTWVVEPDCVFGQPVALGLLQLTENDRALGRLDGTLAGATQRPEKELVSWPLARAGQDAEDEVVANLVPLEGRFMQVMNSESRIFPPF
jgi:hypothetical protein